MQTGLVTTYLYFSPVPIETSFNFFVPWVVFIHYARPDWDEASEEDEEAFDKIKEDKVEGIIEITYKVNTDGTTFDVKPRVSDDRLEVYVPYLVKVVESHKFQPREDAVPAPAFNFVFLHPSDEEEDETEEESEKDDG